MEQSFLSRASEGLRHRFAPTKPKEPAYTKLTQDVGNNVSSVISTPVKPPTTPTIEMVQAPVQPQRTLSEIGYTIDNIEKISQGLVDSIKSGNFPKVIEDQYFSKVLDIVASSPENKIFLQETLRKSFATLPPEKTQKVSEFLAYIRF